MLRAIFFLTLVTLVHCSPLLVAPQPVTFPLSRRFNLDLSLGNLLQRDQARAKALLDRAARKPGKRAPPSANVGVDNSGTIYLSTVGIGTPPTQYTLLIDTGSSNTWVGADRSYRQTSSSRCTGNGTGPVSMSYGSGSFKGQECFDTITLGSGLTITNQSIGVASQSSGFGGIDGILGLGPVDLTYQSVDGVSSVPTIIDNLYAQGTIPQEILGIYFQPSSESHSPNGELTYGGVDASKYTGAITYTPITSAYPSCAFWGIDQNFTYGSTSLSPGLSGIVDTGTTLLLLATDIYDKYVQATGARLDKNSGLLRITQAQYQNLQNLNFIIGGTTFTLTPNGQIWPRSSNNYIGGDYDSIYLIVGDMGYKSGQGFDFINGYAFLERFYSVYDATNQRVGFATTPYTTSTSN
ncbi:acid protease [Sistotremastrum suecicum HHB10207 ss-3]|uniref:Acid protease n=1 Tax=Sistotremastrum suecicum HHB10207 ss-3 TaxID=1314776 RepID=A0A166DJY9_9AGAM|nr:acid protease [Sistotremastrum suecicum HHB10207 ss-3]